MIWGLINKSCSWRTERSLSGGNEATGSLWIKAEVQGKELSCTLKYINNSEILVWVPAPSFFKWIKDNIYELEWQGEVVGVDDWQHAGLWHQDPESHPVCGPV